MEGKLKGILVWRRIGIKRACPLTALKPIKHRLVGVAFDAFVDSFVRYALSIHYHKGAFSSRVPRVNVAADELPVVLLDILSNP